MTKPKTKTATQHDYLHNLVDRLNETPMQRKLRKLAPMPIGSVFIQWPEMTEDDIRQHLRTMKKLGFTNLKGDMLCRPMTQERFHQMAVEEGIIPWFYDIGGYEDITPELLVKLGLPRDMAIDAAIAHPAMQAYQQKVMLGRIARQAADRKAGVHRGKGMLPADADPGAVPGVVHAPEGAKLELVTVPYFVAWLKKNYGEVEALKKAWNCYSASHPGSNWNTWEDVAIGLPQFPRREFRHLRDILRFKADVKLANLRKRVANNLEADPNEPMRAGGEISIFLPHVAWGIDMEGYAEVMADGGAFYPSMHPGWHLEEVGYELVRPTYMQAAMCADWAKGNWSAPFESSGGPQWWSGGGKVPFVAEVKAMQPAFTFTAGTMAQLICSYLGAGFKGFGLWCWNPREASWEAGEYALCDRNNAVTPRAVRVGEFGKAMQKYRREIWQAHKEPYVGLLQEWENDAMWAALAHAGRDRYRMEPIKSRIGAARALINANVPWEHVTMRQLQKGLAGRYRTIYLPACICLSGAMLDVFEKYVRQGGRLVMDMPGAWLDETAKLLATSKGSAFERLFGVVLHEYAYSNNIPLKIGGQDLGGFGAVMTPTSAAVTASYEGGGAAITENSLGKGTAVILGAQASLECFKPGNVAIEELLVKTALGKHQPPITCKGAIVYRMASPQADHYFLVNDGPAKKVSLAFRDGPLSEAMDAVTGKPVKLEAIELEAHGARWIRCPKG